MTTEEDLATAADPQTRRPKTVMYAELMKPDEDWRNLPDTAERRKIQNRLAQRAYRRNMRNKTMEVERLRKQLQELQETEQHQEEQSSASTLLFRDGANSSSSSSSKMREGEAAQADKACSQQSERHRSRYKPAPVNDDPVPFDDLNTSPTMSETEDFGFYPAPGNFGSEYHKRRQQVHHHHHHHQQQQQQQLRHTQHADGDDVPDPPPRQSRKDAGWPHDPSVIISRRDSGSTHDRHTPGPGFDRPDFFHLLHPNNTELYPALGTSLAASTISHLDRDLEMPPGWYPYAGSRSPSKSVRKQSLPGLALGHDLCQEAESRQGTQSPPPPPPPPPTSSLPQPTPCASQPSVPSPQPLLPKPTVPLLHLSIASGQLDTLRLLLRRQDIAINCRDGSGFTPLQRAVMLGRTDMVALLLEHGADLGNGIQEGHLDIVAGSRSETDYAI